ncbi:MAG: outer membrane beta-barrel protein [Ignavibacteriales bacterium]|nr:outer membrane beta-barrel protein [Ignavibacteriales bacterium]
MTKILFFILCTSFAAAQFKPITPPSFESTSLFKEQAIGSKHVTKNSIKEHIHASIGFRLGIFSSSVPQFDSVLGSSSGAVYGLNADFNLFNSMNIEIKYHTFSKAYKQNYESIDGSPAETTSVNEKISWEQNWVTIGPKYFFKPNANVYPYLSVGFGYFGATLDYSKEATDPSLGYSYTIAPRHKTYKTFFGLAFEGGIRYVLADEGLAFFVNGEISLASIQKFRFDESSYSTQKSQDVNIGGIGFTTGFIYIL